MGGNTCAEVDGDVVELLEDGIDVVGAGVGVQDLAALPQNVLVNPAVGMGGGERRNPRFVREGDQFLVHA